MRLAVTIAVPHGSATRKLLTGPEVPLPQQLAALKQLAAERTHPQFEKITVFEFDDSQSRAQRFKPEAEAPAEQSDAQSDAQSDEPIAEPGVEPDAPHPGKSRKRKPKNS
jgi:hypothetical protein